MNNGNEDDNPISPIGLIFSIATFPGVIIHELGHKLFCDLFKIRVIKVCYFQFGNPLGYVIHEKPNVYLQTFFISTGPFIIGTVLSFIRFAFAEIFPEPLNYLLNWLAVSFAMNVFPSSIDTNALWSATNEFIRANPIRNFVLNLVYPIILLMYLTSTRFGILFILYYPIMLYKISDFIAAKYFL